MSNIWEKIGDIVESIVTLDSSSDNVSPKRVAEAEDTLSMQPPGTSVRFADNFSWTRSDHFMPLYEDSKELVHSVLPIIYNSFKNGSLKSKFEFQKCCLVLNKTLEKRFEERRREFHTNGINDLEEIYTFLLVQDMKEMEKLCIDGIKNGNSDSSILGNASMGVHLSKYADLVQPYCNSPYSGFLMIFKVMMGRIKHVNLSEQSHVLNPSPEYDCYMADETGNQKSFFDPTQLYLYDYSGNTLREYPRQVLPYAVMEFYYKPNTVPSSLTNIDISCTPVTTTLISKTSILRSPVDQICSKISTPVINSASCTSIGTKSPSTSEQSQGSNEQEFIVWNGPLTIKGLYACYVDMISSMSSFRPGRLGKDINITHKLDANRVKQKYLKSMGRLRKDQEDLWGHYYVSVCELKPSKPDGNSHFVKMMNYLGRHDCVAVQKLEKDVTLLLLTQGNLSYQLGLTTPNQHPVVMYCLFLSKFSRKRFESGEEHQIIQQIKTEDPIVMPNEMGDNGQLRLAGNVWTCPSCKGDVVTAGSFNNTISHASTTVKSQSLSALSGLAASNSYEVGNKISKDQTEAVNADSSVKSYEEKTIIHESSQDKHMASPLFETARKADDNTSRSPRLDIIAPEVPPDILSLPPDTPYQQTVHSVYQQAENNTASSPCTIGQSNSPLKFRTFPHPQTELNVSEVCLSTVHNTSLHDSSICRTVILSTSDQTLTNDDIIPLTMGHINSPTDSKVAVTAHLSNDNSPSEEMVTPSDLSVSSFKQTNSKLQCEAQLESPQNYNSFKSSVLTAKKLQTDKSIVTSSVHETYRTTYDYYVKVEITNNDKSPVKVLSGCGTPINLLSPATPGTPVMEEEGLIHYYPSTDNLAVNSVNSNRKSVSPGKRFLGHVSRDSNNNTGSIYCSESLSGYSASSRDVHNGASTESESDVTVNGTELKNLQSFVESVPQHQPQISLINPETRPKTLMKPPLIQDGHLSKSSGFECLDRPMPSDSPLEQNIVPSDQGSQTQIESSEILETPKVGNSPNKLLSGKSCPLDLSKKLSLQDGKSSGFEEMTDPCTPVYTVGPSNSPLKFETYVSATQPETFFCPREPLHSTKSKSPRIESSFTSSTTPVQCFSNLSLSSTIGRTPESITLTTFTTQTTPPCTRPKSSRNCSCHKTPIKTSPLSPGKSSPMPINPQSFNSVYQYAFQSSLSQPNVPVQYFTPGYATQLQVSPHHQDLYYPRMSTPLAYEQYSEHWSNFRPSGPVVGYSPVKRPLLGSVPYADSLDRSLLSGLPVQGCNYRQIRPDPPVISACSSGITQASVDHGVMVSSVDTTMSDSAQQTGKNYDEIKKNNFVRAFTCHEKLTADKLTRSSTIEACSPVKSGICNPLVPYNDDDSYEDEKPVVYTDVAEVAVGPEGINYVNEDGTYKSVRATAEKQNVLQIENQSHRDHVEKKCNTRKSVMTSVGSSTVPSKIQLAVSQINYCSAGLNPSLTLQKFSNLEEFEMGFMPAPPKSSMLQVEKVRDGFLVQEKSHDVIMKSPDGKLPIQSVSKISKNDFSEELNVKPEPIDRTIDNIINFLDFESKSNGKIKNKKEAPDACKKAEMNAVDPSQMKGGRWQYKTCQNQAKQTSTIECQESKDNESVGMTKKHTLKKGNKQSRIENSFEQLPNKKIKLENGEDTSQNLMNVEVVSVSDSSDIEFIGLEPPMVDLTKSPTVSMTESPSPIRIVKTVTGYKVEKSCRMKLPLHMEHVFPIDDQKVSEEKWKSKSPKMLSLESQFSDQLLTGEENSSDVAILKPDMSSKVKDKVSAILGEKTESESDDQIRSPASKRLKFDVEQAAKMKITSDKNNKTKEKSIEKTNKSKIPVLKSKNSLEKKSNSVEKEVEVKKPVQSEKDENDDSKGTEKTKGKGSKKAQRLSAIFEEKFSPVKFTTKKKIDIKLKFKNKSKESSKTSKDKEDQSDSTTFVTNKNTESDSKLDCNKENKETGKITTKSEISISSNDSVTEIKSGEKKTEAKEKYKDSNAKSCKESKEDKTNSKEKIDEKTFSAKDKVSKSSSKEISKNQENKSRTDSGFCFSSDHKKSGLSDKINDKRPDYKEKVTENKLESKESSKQDNKSNERRSGSKEKSNGGSYKAIERSDEKRSDSKEKSNQSKLSTLENKTNSDKGNAKHEKKKKRPENNSRLLVTAWDAVMKSYDKKSLKKVPKQRNECESYKTDRRWDDKKVSRDRRKRSESESSRSYRKRMNSESDSDARSRTGSPNKRNISKSSYKQPSTPLKSKDGLSPRKQIQVHDLGLPKRKELDFKIPKLSSKNKTSDAWRNYNSSRHGIKYYRDFSKNSDYDSDSSQKSDRDFKKRAGKKISGDKNRNSREKTDNYSSQKKDGTSDKSRIKTDNLLSGSVSSIMKMIEGQVLSKARESPVDLEGTRTPSDINSADVSADEEFDLNCGFKVIDEVGTDTESTKDSSTMNVSDDFAADVNNALPVYGSNTKNLFPDVRKEKSQKSAKEKLKDTIENTQKVIDSYQNAKNNINVDNDQEQRDDNVKNSVTPVTEISTSSGNTNNVLSNTNSSGKPVLIVDPFELDDFVPSVKRQINEVEKDKQLRVTFRNDLSLQNPMMGYSQVELIRTCLHGKVDDMRILSFEEAVIQKSVSLTLHKLNISAIVERTVDDNEDTEEKNLFSLKQKKTDNLQVKDEIIPGLGDLNFIDSTGQDVTPEFKVKNDINECSRSSSVEKKDVISTIKGPKSSKQMYEFEDYFGVKDYNQLVLGDITNTVSSPKAPTSSAGYSFNDYFGVKDYNQFIAVKRVQKQKEICMTVSKEDSKQGPIRSNVTKVNRQERQHHPYIRKEKTYKEGWSFNINVTLKEMMKNLTTCLYRKRGTLPAPRSSRPRFAHYRFRRSEVPEFLPEDREYNDLTEEAIPNFNERRQRAELLDTMTGSNGEEEPYAVEQDIYDRDEVVPQIGVVINNDNQTNWSSN